MSKKLPLNFILSFCRDKIPQKGEDCYCYSFCDSAGLLGVFDGCGGAGARKHALFSEMSEAYMASRLCAGAFFDIFRHCFPCHQSPQVLANIAFLPDTKHVLDTFQPAYENTGIGIKSSLIRTLPSTVAVALIQQVPDDRIQISALWAGDSRVYLLNSTGLAQLSVDDTSVPDPMDNLYKDGRLTNVFCCDRKLQLHCNTIQAEMPCIVLAATDGCFGYLSTPMEFEGMLLQTLLEADSPAQWEESLVQRIGAVAGDDHTMCLAAYGYADFNAIKENLSKRYQHLCENYLSTISAFSLSDYQSRYALWLQYKPEYMRYLKDGPV